MITSKDQLPHIRIEDVELDEKDFTLIDDVFFAYRKVLGLSTDDQVRSWVESNQTSYKVAVVTALMVAKGMDNMQKSIDHLSKKNEEYLQERLRPRKFAAVYTTKYEAAKALRSIADEFGVYLELPEGAHRIMPKEIEIDNNDDVVITPKDVITEKLRLSRSKIINTF